MADIKVYTVDEVCDILSVTQRTMYNYIGAGKLKAFKMGKYWRIREEDLRAFISGDIPVVDANRRPSNQKKNKG